MSSSFWNITNDLSNRLRNNLLSPEEVRERRRTSAACEVVRIAAVVAAIGSVAIFCLSFASLNPAVIVAAGVFMLLTAVVSHEVHVVAINVKGIMDSALKELKFSACDGNYGKMKYLAQNTAILSHLITLTK
jgi:uncharacterized Fe-S cluster-containing radical SAM superfamily protein